MFVQPDPNQILQLGNTENLSENRNNIAADYSGTGEEVQPEVQTVKPKFDKTASLPRPLSHPNEGKLEKIDGKDVWVYPTGLQEDKPWINYDSLYVGGLGELFEQFGFNFTLTSPDVFPPPHSLSEPQDVSPPKWKFEPHNNIEIVIRRKKAGAGFMEGDVEVDGKFFCKCLEKTVNNSLLTAGAVGVDAESSADSSVYVDLSEGLYSAYVAFNEQRQAWMLKMDSYDGEEGNELQQGQKVWFLGDRKPHPDNSLITIGFKTQKKEVANDPYKINQFISLMTTETYEIVPELVSFKQAVSNFRYQDNDTINSDTNPISLIGDFDDEEINLAATETNTNSFVYDKSEYQDHAWYQLAKKVLESGNKATVKIIDVEPPFGGSMLNAIDLWLNNSPLAGIINVKALAKMLAPTSPFAAIKNIEIANYCRLLCQDYANTIFQIGKGFVYVAKDNLIIISALIAYDKLIYPKIKEAMEAVYDILKRMAEIMNTENDPLIPMPMTGIFRDFKAMEILCPALLRMLENGDPIMAFCNKLYKAGETIDNVMQAGAIAIGEINSAWSTATNLVSALKEAGNMLTDSKSTMLMAAVLTLVAALALEGTAWRRFESLIADYEESLEKHKVNFYLTRLRDEYVHSNFEICNFEDSSVNHFKAIAKHLALDEFTLKFAHPQYVRAKEIKEEIKIKVEQIVQHVESTSQEISRLAPFIPEIKLS